jgi:hypothetical protein
MRCPPKGEQEGTGTSGDVARARPSVYPLAVHAIPSLPRSPVMPVSSRLPSQELILAEVVTDAVLDAASAWLYQ